MKRPVAISISAKHRNTLGRGNSSVGRASDCKAWHNTYVGSSPWCGKGLFSQSTFSADSLTVSVQLPCATACIIVWAHIKNPKHWHPYHCLDTCKCCTHRQVWVCSVALAAVAPYPGKATQISHNGQQSTTTTKGGVGGGGGGGGFGLPQHTKEDKAQLPQRALETAPTAIRLHC